MSVAAPRGAFTPIGPDGRPLPPGRPEDGLLLSCARASEDVEQADRIAARAGGSLDWAYLVDQASRHGLLPLLHARLSAACPAIVPDEILTGLAATARATARRNLALSAELVKVLDELEGRGIRAVPYKGPVLAASVYGSVALREFSDLDVLVHERDVPSAKALLLSRGYRPRFQLTPRQEAAFLRQQYEYLFFREADGIIMEVQWRLAPRYFSCPLDYAELWRRLVRVPLAGRMVPSLSPEDLLLALCVHGTKHLWRRLGWICDVARLLAAHPGLEWAYLTELAAKTGTARMLRLGLLLARDLAGATAPPPVMRRVDADPAVQGLARRVRQRLFQRDRGEPGLVESSWFHLEARERGADRVRYCAGLMLATTPGDWELVTLPAPLFLLYYPLRFVRLAVKYGSASRRRFRTGSAGEC